MSIKQIEISFPRPVPADPYTEALSASCRAAGPCLTSIDGGDENRMVLFTAVYDKPVEPPDGLGHVLDLIVGMACNAYQRENPTRVMWPAGHGFKPCWSRADAAFLGQQAAPDAPETGEPTFDEETYCIQCEEREDLHGSNPLNPDGAKLRETAEQARKCARILKEADKRIEREALLIAAEHLPNAASMHGNEAERVASVLRRLAAKP